MLSRGLVEFFTNRDVFIGPLLTSHGIYIRAPKRWRWICGSLKTPRVPYPFVPSHNYRNYLRLLIYIARMQCLCSASNRLLSYSIDPSEYSIQLYVVQPVCLWAYIVTDCLEFKSELEYTCVMCILIYYCVLLGDSRTQFY